MDEKKTTIRHVKKSAQERDCRGFTLIEVLLAMSILSVALLGTSALITGILSGNSYSSRLTTATTLAQGKMEDVRRLGYAGVSASTENYGEIAGFSLFKRETTIDSSTPGMKIVSVSVRWASDDRSVDVKTILME